MGESAGVRVLGRARAETQGCSRVASATPMLTLRSAAGAPRLLTSLFIASTNGLAQYFLELNAVPGLRESFCQLRELGTVDVALAIRYLFRAADLESLSHLDGLDEIRGREQGRMRARVEPGDTAAEKLYV